MSMLSAIIGLFRRGTSSFNDVEMRILHGVIEKLSKSEATSMRLRLGHVNLVQRLEGGRSVNCYEKSGGGVVFRDEDKLPYGPEEFNLATFTFKTRDGHPIAGTIWLVNCMLFSIEFDTPTEHLEHDDVLDLKVLLDEKVKGISAVGHNASGSAECDEMK
jgi:hypothetical protein